MCVKLLLAAKPLPKIAKLQSNNIRYKTDKSTYLCLDASHYKSLAMDYSVYYVANASPYVHVSTSQH